MPVQPNAVYSSLFFETVTVTVRRSSVMVELGNDAHLSLSFEAAVDLAHQILEAFAPVDAIAAGDEATPQLSLEQQ